MKRCRICGKIIQFRKEDRYEVTKHPAGINKLVEGITVYECFDCHKCGCQNIVNIREVNGYEWKEEGSEEPINEE